VRTLGMRLGVSEIIIQVTFSIPRVPTVQAEYCLPDIQSQRSGGTIWMLTYLQLGDTSKHLQLCVVYIARAAGSNLRMVRPSLMLVVKLPNNSRAKCTANFAPS